MVNIGLDCNPLIHAVTNTWEVDYNPLAISVALPWEVDYNPSAATRIRRAPDAH